MHLLIVIAFLLSEFQEVDPVGTYKFESQISKFKNVVMDLKIKKKGYELNSTSDFKGSFTETGTWELKGDELILRSEWRKDKYDKKNSYNKNYKKQAYGYERKEVYLVFEDQLCSKNSDGRGKGKCFMRQ